MEAAEFIEATGRMEKNYNKTYTPDQIKIMFDELKNMKIERYRAIITQIIRNEKFLPKLADIIDYDIKTPTEKLKAEIKACSRCGGTGYLIYKKKIENRLNDYVALCSCGNAREYSKNGYYIPHIEEVEAQA